MTLLTDPLGRPHPARFTTSIGRSIHPLSRPCRKTSSKGNRKSSTRSGGWSSGTVQSIRMPTLIGSAALSKLTLPPRFLDENLTFVPNVSRRFVGEVCVDHLEQPGGHGRIVGQRTGHRGPGGVA